MDEVRHVLDYGKHWQPTMITQISDVSVLSSKEFCFYNGVKTTKTFLVKDDCSHLIEVALSTRELVLQ